MVASWLRSFSRVTIEMSTMSTKPFIQFRQELRRPFLLVLLASIVVLVLVFLYLRALVVAVQPDGSHELKPDEWRFIVSGDSRNCGDVVMPAIAAHSARYSPSFYWHLGDLRAIYKIDEDMAAASAKAGRPLSCQAYYDRAWPDFIDNQIRPFSITRFYLGIGNHEVIPPKGPSQFTAGFADWLLTPRAQSKRDDEKRFAASQAEACRKLTLEEFLGLQDKASKQTYWEPRAWYHWIQGGVDFIYLDNSLSYFSPDQVAWFKCLLALDEPKDEKTQQGEANQDKVNSVVLGMHEALPESLASDHGMCDVTKKTDPDWKKSCDSGNEVYDSLLDFHVKTGKPVYVLASHSHFYMSGIFDKHPKQALPGWIVGTAGAVRYGEPENMPPGTDIKINAYGYLLGTVHFDGRIRFEFKEVKEKDVPSETRQKYPSSFVPWCFVHNSEAKDSISTETTNRCTVPWQTKK